MTVPQPVDNIARDDLSKILFELVDTLTRATSLTDVNIAAGIAWNELLGLEVIDLLADRPDELGQVLDLPL